MRRGAEVPVWIYILFFFFTETQKIVFQIRPLYHGEVTRPKAYRIFLCKTNKGATDEEDGQTQTPKKSTSALAYTSAFS